MAEITHIPTEQLESIGPDRYTDPKQIDELSRSIKQIGVIEPLIVARHNTTLKVIAGRRRLKAAKLAGVETVPAIIVEADLEKSLAIAYHENIFRQDLSAVDEARFYGYLRDTLRFSGKKTASLTNKSEPYISQRLAILLWHPRLVEALGENQISFSVARELSIIKQEEQLLHYLRHAIIDGVNVRTVKIWIAQYQKDQLTQQVQPPVYNKPPGSQTTHAVLCQCFWCKEKKDILTMNQIDLCPECTQDWTEAKENKERIEAQGD